MSRVSSGISDFDKLIDLLYTGDNVVWEVEAGTSYEIFVHNFARQSLADDQNVIYVSFNKSPQSILLWLRDIPYQESFVLLDCFTSGKGKNDKAFTKFYEQKPDKRVIKVEKPFDISHFTDYLNSIEDRFPASKYVFDSLTGMQDLWGDESSTYKFFTYMCPRLYDLGTVAYWILEKEAHSDTFKANLRHITQVVLNLYKRRDSPRTRRSRYAPGRIRPARRRLVRRRHPGERRYVGARNLQALVALPRHELADEWVGHDAA